MRICLPPTSLGLSNELVDDQLARLRGLRERHGGHERGGEDEGEEAHRGGGGVRER